MKGEWLAAQKENSEVRKLVARMAAYLDMRMAVHLVSSLDVNWGLKLAVLRAG